MWFDGKNKEQEKKQKTAVAVAYEPGDAAPKILAAGKGEVAERIIEKAKELIDGYFETYPQIKEYMDKSIDLARRQGYIETIFLFYNH